MKPVAPPVAAPLFNIADSWVWDFWTVDDGERYHLFFLFASRALHDPHARHLRASIGHAVSDDFVHWTRVADALVRSDAPAFDDVATWTGCTVRRPDGGWRMFYTGVTRVDGFERQSIGFADSDDLLTWTKRPGPVLSADPRWYETLADGIERDEAFRDPWVFADPGGDGWRMLVTAHANHGAREDRGVIAQAWSSDLDTWELGEPLTAPGAGFGHIEVTNTVVVGGQGYLLFSCLADQLSGDRAATGGTGGTWAVPWDITAPVVPGAIDLSRAQLLTDSRLYVGRVAYRREEPTRPLFLAFEHDGEDGAFVGGVVGPWPLVADTDGKLALLR